MTNPIFAYGHESDCDAITAGAFVPNGVWPTAFDGSYLFGDYLCGKIWQLVPSGDGFTAAEFASDLGVGGPIAMIFGPSGGTQALYYTTYANGGQVRRIDFTEQQNQPPVAAIAADVSSGPAPLTVQFDGSASSDPDAGDSLTYIWDFGDGTPVTETTTATAKHEYTNPGSFTTSLTVRDDHGATSAPATVGIQVSSPLGPPENTDLPDASGVPRVGSTLAAAPGSWTSSEPLDFSFQWLRCNVGGDACVAVSGATEATYTLTSDDFGSSMRVVVTASNPAGMTLAISAPTSRVKHACNGSACSTQSS
jgi:PKD repeat protein